MYTEHSKVQIWKSDETFQIEYEKLSEKIVNYK